MLTLPLLILAFPAQEAVETPQTTPQTTEIAKALEELAKSSSYTFKMTTTDTGTPTSGRGGRGGQGGRQGRGGGAGGPGAEPSADAGAGTAADSTPPSPPEPVVLTGHVQKDLPIHLLQGGMEAWRSDDGTVLFLTDGEWKAVDGRSMRGGVGRGGQGGQGAQAGTDADATKLRGQMGLMRARTATDVLTGFADKIEAIGRTESGGAIRFRGTLTEEGVTSLLGGQRGRGGRGGRGGGQGGGASASMSSSGHFEVVLSAKGTLQSVIVETEQSGSQGDRPFKRGRKTVIEITAVGETTLEVPEAVQAGFAEAAKAAAAPRSEEF